MSNLSDIPFVNQFGDALDAAIAEPVSSRRPRRRISRGALIAIAAAVSLTVAALAVAGALPNPWSGPSVSTLPFVTSPDPASLAGATVKLRVPGPESTTFEIVTDRFSIGSSPGECMAIVVEEPRGQSEHLTSQCGGSAAAAPTAATIQWQAPSGATFAIVSGPSPADTTKVALTNSSGFTLTTEPAGGGYYLVYVPVKQTPTDGVLNFYNASGKLIDSQNLQSAATP